MRPRHIIGIVAALWSGARLLVASPDPPLQPGERLSYWVSWAIVPGAGEIKVGADKDPMSPGELKITTSTATRGLARWLLPFDATADSYYDDKTGRLMRMHDRSNVRGRHQEHMVTFDYSDRQARYATLGDTTARLLSMPPGAPTDLITALFETRLWNLKPGEARDALVLFGDEFYELTIHALRLETITTDLGTFQTLVLEPRMEKTPPKGMFRKGSTVRVWISQDERRLPVKFEVEFNIGTGTATLDSYTPPTATTRSREMAETPATTPDSGRRP